MIIKRTISFQLEKRKKDGKLIVKDVPIRMRVCFNSTRVDYPIGYRIDMSKWDESKQKVKNGCTNLKKQSSAEINGEIMSYSALVQNLFKEYEVHEIMPTPHQFKDAVSLRIAQSLNSGMPVGNIEFFVAFKEFVRDCGSMNDWTDSTYEKFSAVEKHLHDFQPRLTFDYFTEVGLNRYVNFLRDKLDMRNSTIGKQMGFLKWFLRWAHKKGYHNNLTFQTFKPKLKTTTKKVIFLTWDELNKLKDCELPINKQYLERVRDVFLFCCFTGLRYSDVYNLKCSDVKKDFIEITTIKTADSLKIELNKHSRAILNKYKKIKFPDNKVLPVISNQRMNVYLKELAEIAGIDEPIRETYYQGNNRIDHVVPKYTLIGTHAGRRTFICNALGLGIPAQVVMKWTGHSDYKAMKPYIDIADNIKASAMSKFDQM